VPAIPLATPDPGRLLSVTAVPGERPGRVVVQVTGEVDTFTAPLLELCLDSQAEQHGLRELVVDLEQVTFLGAAGVRALAVAYRRCRSRGTRLVLRGADRRRVLRPLQLTGLADQVPIDRAGGAAAPRRCSAATAAASSATAASRARWPRRPRDRRPRRRAG
jgi:anti-anti-sigma factor